MGNVLIQPKYSDRPPPQTMNDNQSFGRINDICVCLCVCVCGGKGGGTLNLAFLQAYQATRQEGVIRILQSYGL